MTPMFFDSLKCIVIDQLVRKSMFYMLTNFELLILYSIFGKLFVYIIKTKGVNSTPHAHALVSLARPMQTEYNLVLDL